MATTPKWKSRKVREKPIEEYLCSQVRKLGGRAYKVAATHDPSMPDRHVHFIRDWKFYVECKRPGETATPAQRARHEELRLFGSRVYVVSTKEEVDGVLREEVFAACRAWWLLAVGTETAERMEQPLHKGTAAVVLNQWPAAYKELFCA